MKEKRDLYNMAMELLEEVNKALKDEPSLSTINIQLSGVVKNLNDINIRELTGVNASIEDKNER